ncbi:MAG: flagellar hook-basal body complex protein [Alphaproteobacteria bacterium]
MSIFGAMQAGVSGLAAQSSAMGGISDNIVNISTVGYKGVNTQFSTLVTTQTSSAAYSSGGVQAVSTQDVSVQGLLAANSSSTALSVSGDGFFVVNTAAQPGSSDMWAYTRAGDFSIDNQGYLKNTGDFYLQGWSLLPYDGSATASTVEIDGTTYMKAYYDTNGDTVYVNDNIIDSNNLKGINLTSIGGTATPTTQISYGANLPSGDAIYNPADSSAGGLYSVSALIYDSLGNASNVSINYTKTSSNGWEMSSTIPTGAAVVTMTGESKQGNPNPDVYSAVGQLEFTGIPENGSQVKVNDITYVFQNGGGTDTTDTVYVDLDPLLSSSDFSTAFAEKLQSTQSSGDRFQADGTRVLINQSILGEEISVDASLTTNCIQTSTNPNPDTGLATGVFTISAISENITNGGAIEFNAQPTAGQKMSLDGQTYTFITEATYNANVAAETVNPNDVVIGANLQATLANLQSTITATAKEPSRFNVSGSTLEILPTSSGGEISFSVGDIDADAKFRESGGDWVERDSGAIGGTFYANGLDTALEEGSRVPSVRFNADGTPKYSYTDAMNIVWSNGAENMGEGIDAGASITLKSGNVGTSDGLTSLAGSFTTNYISQDGAKFGSYSDVFVDESGVVTALFDNGETRPIAILPLATFSNPEGLESLTGNSWMATDVSGDGVLKMATTNGSGSIESYSLEGSTVDIAAEFSNMIVVQRAYSASTQIITTADEMLQELTNMV